MFSFPLLTNDEILTCLRELEFSISEEELRDPERHRVAIRVVLEQLMEMCVGVTREDLSTAKVSVGRETICYPELHEDSITELAMFRAVADMMRTCGVADFGLRDWFSPTPKRLRKNLSAVLNFAKYREDMLIVYKQLCEWRDGQLSRVREARAEADVAARELEVLEGATTGDRREAAAVAADVDAMEAAAADAARGAAAARAARDAAADAAGAARCQAQGHAAALERARSAGRELQARGDAAAAPDAVRSRIAAAAESLAAHDAAVDAEAAAVADARAGASRLADAKADVAAAADAVLAVERDLEDQKRSLRELRDLEAARARGADDVRALATCLKTADANRDHADEKLRYVVERAARADPGGAAARLRKELAQLDGDRVARVALKRHLDDRERAFRAEVAARDDADRAADLWIGAAARDLERLVRTTATAPRAVAA